MNTYLIQSKVKYIKKFKEDFERHYNEVVHPFSSKNFFYFFVHDDKKYVHKESLKFIYSNGETYSDSIDPTYCPLKKHPTVDIESFLSNEKITYCPQLLEENDSFFVFDYVKGDPVDSVTADEYNQLKQKSFDTSLTPWYNSMTYNLIRSPQGILLVDYKHFEKRKDLPFFMYFYNKKNLINDLYIDSDYKLDLIRGHIGKDYPIREARVIRYET